MGKVGRPPVKTSFKKGDARSRAAASKGGKTKKIQTKILKELKDIAKLDSNNYMEKIDVINPSTGDRKQTYSILLAGEKGFDYLLSRRFTEIEESIQQAMAKTNNPKEHMELMKQGFNTLKQLRETLYGTNTNIKADVKTEDVSKDLWDKLGQKWKK